MILRIAELLAGTKFIREALEHPADLSEFKERPTPRLITGLVLMGFSYIMGWPAVTALSMIAVYLQEPLIAIIGCPTTYGLSYIVFFVGAWLARAPHYMGIVTRYAVGKLFRNLLRREPVGKKFLSGWDFFDRLYCISLEEREDRRQAAAAQFSRVGLDGKVEFVLVKRHPFDVEQGIYESHLACLRKGLEAGAENMVVFEDDVLFDRFDTEHLQRCTRFLSLHPDWKVLLFGALVRSSRKTEEPAVQKVRYQSLAHAYALNRPYAETLAYQSWQGLAYDVLFRPLTDGVYAVKPMFAFQGDALTDNKYRWLDRFRRLCGGFERIQKGIEFYHCHKIGIIAAHVLLILLFVLAFFLLR